MLFTLDLKEERIDEGRKANVVPALYGRGLIVIALMLFIGGHCLEAQQTVTSATLSGLVEDAGGCGSSRCNPDGDQSGILTKSTPPPRDGVGHFRFPYLPVGSYNVAIEARGFAPLTKQLTVTVGQALDLPLTLEVAGVSARVDISADAAVIETVRTQVTETVRPAEINSLPLNGRNYLDLALLVTGVSPTNTGSNQRFAETSAVPGQGISVAVSAICITVS